MDYSDIVNSGEFDPFVSLEPIEYVGMVDVVNQNHLHQLQLFFGSFNLNDGCVVVTGSDGKRERHVQSKTELIAFQPSSRSNLALALKAHIGTDFFYDSQHALESYIEVKYIEGNWFPLSCVFNNTEAVYPDRVLQSTVVFGNPSYYYAARKQVLYELCYDENLAPRVRKKMKEQLDTYKQSIKRGSFRGNQLFDVEKTLQYYNESPSDEKNKIQGFKMSYLRAVQRKLDLIVAKSIIDGAVDLEDVATNMPSATLERLDFLSKRNVLPSELTQQVGRSYGWFLQQYHRSQAMFKSLQTYVATPFDQEEYHYYEEVISKNFVYFK
jgi:hypothetical protein